MTVELLYIIIDELSNFHRSKDELDKVYIEQRLNKSLKSYIKEMDESSLSIK